MKKPFVRAAVAVVLVLGSVFATSTPANAYPAGSLHTHWAVQDAYNCNRISVSDSLWAPYYDMSGGRVGVDCLSRTRWYGVWDLPADAGGRNTIVDITDNQDYSDKTVVRFQAYGEHLMVIDPTTTDGDTIYVWIGALGPFCGCAGTNNYDLDLIEDAVYQLKITDDKAGTEVIASSLNGTLPAIHA
jgi:hypothetical protein